jgi:putative ABC transport system substrate-binding protein
MKWRRFFEVIGAVVCLVPLDSVSFAQQSTPPPLVGIMSSGSPGSLPDAGVIEGLRQSGFVVGRNIQIEYRYASGAFDRIPAMTSELLDMRPAAILTLGTAAARSAREVLRKTSPQVPLVFSFGSDPVAEGMVASMNRPGGTITGVTSIAGSLGPKRLELLRQVVRDGKAIGLLVNLGNPLGIAERRDVEAAARSVGQRMEVLPAASEAQIEAAFLALPQQSIGGVVIAVDTFYFGRMRQMATLATRMAVPAISPLRDFPGAGGLMSYGASIHDVNRQAGGYLARVLKGEKPADLPVLQPTKFELIINLKTAKALDIEMPAGLLATADEVIE